MPVVWSNCGGGPWGRSYSSKLRQRFCPKQYAFDSVSVVSPLPLPVKGSLRISGTPEIVVVNAPDVNVLGMPAVALQPNTTIGVTNTPETALFVIGVNDQQAALTPAGLLPAGGRTIGGPAETTLLAVMTPVNLLETDIAMKVCVTVVNTGSSVIELQVVPGKTLYLYQEDKRTYCAEVPAMGRIRLRCPEGPSPNCSGVWRIDQTQ